ncbi:MAG: hypothetical protein HZB84_08480 [Deltaproteobacteria bacterium]|nr:hypothetical protein [Deltaproteobacteria bacterium]
MLLRINQASTLKASLGAIPYAGSLLAELAGTIIPNQRINRIIRFAEILDKRLEKIEKEFIRSQFQNENFTDLLEEGLRQSARSLTDERREYIASIISNSLSSKDIEYLESKHLLRILDQINDIEVIWLRFYLNPTIGGDKDFREKHKEILKPITRAMNTPQSIKDKGTLQDSYKEHLALLGLLKKTVFETKNPNLSSFGELLLRGIGLIVKGV